MINRVSSFFSALDDEYFEEKYSKYFDRMNCNEIQGEFSNALAFNNSAYVMTFTLFERGIEKQKQLQRLEELMKRAELYLRKLNLDGAAA